MRDHQSLRLAAAPLLAVVVCTVLSVGCSDQRIVEPECEGCFRFHVDFPNGGTQTVLRDIFFVDSANGWVVGNDGTILHSSDGGATWSTQHQGTGGRLWGVYFQTPDLGYVVGEDDTLYRTGDGGDTWMARPTPGYDLTAIHMVDQWRGWTVGADIILNTNNGGTSWQVYVDRDNVVDTLYGVTFADTSKGWAIGSGDYKILYTDDAGVHWSPQSNPSTQPLLDVAFADASHGWAVGVGATIVHTANSGATWTKQSIGTDRVLHGVDFWDVNTGVVVGDSGVVFTTTDGGANWEERVSGTNNDLLKVSYIDANSFCICGADGTLRLFTLRWNECCE